MLGKYIDQAARKDQYSCARICVEVDLEEGLSEAIKLIVVVWTHVQELDYEHLPFKCRHCHGHSNLAKHYKKKVEEQRDKQNGDQWTLVHKTTHPKKGAGKGNTTGIPSSSKPNQEDEANAKGTASTQINPAASDQENLVQAESTPPSKEGEKAMQTEVTQGSPSNPSYVEVTRKKAIESSGSSEDETYERPSKRVGRKSCKEMREEEAERLKTQGSQATIEMSIGRNTRPRPSKGGLNPPLCK